MAWIAELRREVHEDATLTCPFCKLVIKASERKTWIGCDPCRDEPPWVVTEPKYQEGPVGQC